MQEIIEALEAAGYTYMKNVWEPSFDGPLDFFGRQENDDIMVLGEVEEAARGIIVRLRPHDKFKEWYIEDFEEIPTFIEEFDATFKEFAQYIEDNWTW
jgi:hypothetical protein